ncbi:MAG TPA: septum formation initiator family protein [Candidatus Paceibacterota bacterium]
MSVRLWKRLFARLAVWVILAGLFLLLLVVANSTWHVYQKQREAAHEYNLQAEALVDLEARNESLRRKLSALNTDRGIEEELRERFSVAKPGEEVIVLVDAEKSGVDGNAESRESIWQSFLDWVSYTRD